MEERVAKGLLDNDVELLREPHDVLQRRVETVLSGLIGNISKAVMIESWFSPLGIPGGRPPDRLTYTEKIKLVRRAAELEVLTPEMVAEVGELPDTVRIRNAYAHQRLGEIGVSDVALVMRAYCRFLERWGGGVRDEPESRT